MRPAAGGLPKETTPLSAAPVTTCPGPVHAARRGDQFTWLDQHGRGAGFSDTIEQPATCSDPACDWEDRPGPTAFRG